MKLIIWGILFCCSWVHICSEETKKYRDKKRSSIQNTVYTLDGIPMMPPLVAGALYQMAYHLTQILDKYNVRYWADSGTVLGIERHKGLIPHDDDIDLCIFPRDEEKLKNPTLIQDLHSVGLKVVNHWIGAKVCTRKPHPLGHTMRKRGYTYSTPSIDLFFMKKIYLSPDFKKAYKYRKTKAENFWPNYIHYHEDVFDIHGTIRKKQFGPISLNTLSETGAREYCTRIYGENCMFEIELWYSHLNERRLKRVCVPLTDYRAASYIEWDGLMSIK